MYFKVKEFHKYFVDKVYNTNYFFEDINNIIEHLLEIGKKDDIVTIDEESYKLLLKSLR